MGARAIDRPQVDLETHERLVAWARWCRGNYLPSWFQLVCGSIERGYLAPAGDVFMTAEEALAASIKAAEPISRGDEWETERAVVSLPERPRMCLRLHYVGYRRVPMARKRRLLGVTEQEYGELLLRSAQMLKNRLQMLDIRMEMYRITGATERPQF